MKLFISEQNITLLKIVAYILNLGYWTEKKRRENIMKLAAKNRTGK